MRLKGATGVFRSDRHRTDRGQPGQPLFQRPPVPGTVPISRAALRPGSATAITIEFLWTSRPTYRTFDFGMDESSRCGSVEPV